jgi:hypothetical protein
VREYNEAVFSTFWTDGRDISDPAVLGQIMSVIGLEFSAAVPGLKSGEYEHRFEDAKALSRKLGITAVPAFIIDDKYLISGAQPVEVFRQVLQETSSPGPGSDSAQTDSDIFFLDKKILLSIKKKPLAGFNATHSRRFHGKEPENSNTKELDKKCYWKGSRKV